MLGELSQLLLDGQRVVPTEAVKAGYRFRFPTVPEALADLVPARASARNLMPTEP